MNALISPNEKVNYISGWEAPVPPSTKYTPIYTYLGQRIAQVEQTTFPVAPPLFWIPCADNIIAQDYYYDPSTQTIIIIPPDVPQPQPITTGTQTA